jgi:hypothetical protein
MTAGLTAWCSDTHLKKQGMETALRLLEAFVQAGVAALLAFGVHAMLAANYQKLKLDESQLPPVFALAAVMAAIGFIVGFCVPHWARAHRSVYTESKKTLPCPGAAPAPEGTAPDCVTS